MNRIAILITCYNRKEKTLGCLERVFSQKEKVDVYLVDDGCTDGTSAAVSSRFPEVRIIAGDGNLFWNRGMYTAWAEAEKGDYDYYIWLNDDTFIFDGALDMMLKASCECEDRALIVGASCSPLNHSITTFGADYKKKPIFPNGKLQRCDAFGGNFVLVPRFIFNSCGKLDFYYRHSLGDIDYAKTVLRNEHNIFLAPAHAGECVNDSKIARWLDPSKSLKERYRLLRSPLSYADPKEFFYFHKKHDNFLVASVHVISIYMKLLLVPAYRFLKR